MKRSAPKKRTVLAKVSKTNSLHTSGLDAQIARAARECCSIGYCERCGWMPGDEPSGKSLEAHHAIKRRHRATAALKENLVCFCASKIIPGSCHKWADTHLNEFIQWFDAKRGAGEYDRLHDIAQGLVR